VALVLVRMHKKLALKYYETCDPPAQNGTKYDAAIDITIINELSHSGRVSSGKLKKSIEGILRRHVPRRTYYTHLSMMIKDGLLDRIDTGRGAAVDYSLSEAARKKQKLMLLWNGPDYGISSSRIIKEAYVHILFSDIINNDNNGVSIKDLERKYRQSSYENDIIKAFKLLVENGLIKPKGKQGYTLADPELEQLLVDILDYRKKIKDAEGKQEIRQIWEEYEMLEVQRRYSDDRVSVINRIGTKHANALKKFSFLRDVIQMYCPLLFPELPYRDLMSNS
jgi:hypothetical protein